MLFDIEYPDKITPTLAVPEKSVPNGARVIKNTAKVFLFS